MTYSSNYKQQKPLSKRLKVESGTTEPQNIKRKPKATAKPQGLPAYISPIRAPEAKPMASQKKID